MKRALALLAMLASSASSTAAAVMALMKQGKTEIVAVDPIMKKEMNVKVYKKSDCTGPTFNVVNIRPNGTAKVKDFEGSLLSFMEAEHGDLMKELTSSGRYDDEIAKIFKEALDKFVKTQSW